jgi:3-oxoacyl-[acyl-carrier protein] reductase
MLCAFSRNRRTSVFSSKRAGSFHSQKPIFAKEKTDMNLTGKRALVGGGSDGIGKATAIQLANSGAEVTLVARSEEKLNSVVSQLDASVGQQHAVLVADYSEPTDVRSIVERHLEKTGDIPILINNSGGPPGGRVFDANLNEFELAFRQHLECNHALTQALVPGMRRQGYGRIINVISTSVKQPLANLGVSNTIRGAVANWSKTLANELGRYGITVNNVLPGATLTGRLHSIIENQSQRLGVSPEEVADKMKQEIPANRFAAPEEIAKAIVFLASEDASYINGVNLPVDGGRTKSL